MSAMLGYLNARAIAYATFIATTNNETVIVQKMRQWRRFYFEALDLHLPNIMDADDLKLIVDDGDVTMIRNVLALLDEVA